MAAHVFQVEFGLHETPLTQSLESGQFYVAEKMIRDCTAPSYLDEGCYVRIPLVITLKPKDFNIPSNFYIARLLLEHGANPNLRIPNTDGAEFMDPGSTPLQLLLQFYVDTIKCSNRCHDEEQHALRSTSPDHLNLIGLSKKPVRSEIEFQEEVLKMCSILIGYGADVNVVSGFGTTPLHLLTECCCFSHEMVDVLVENGADVNSLSFLRHTPLMNVCADNWDFFPNDETNGNTSACISHKNNRLQQLECLLQHTDIQLNLTNKQDQTALFLACTSGQWLSCKHLLQFGAAPDAKGTICCDFDDVWIPIMHVSPLIAALCSQCTKKEITKYPKEPLQLRGLGSLVDTGCLENDDVWFDLCRIIRLLFDDFVHLISQGRDLIHLLFGQTSCDLTQQSVRIVFQSLFRNYCLWRWALDTHSKKRRQPEIHWTNPLNCKLRKFVEILRIPSSLEIRFEIEMLRLCLCKYFIQYDALPCDPLGDSSDSDDFLGGDSDIDYW